jgi:hypothetical protein
MNGKGDGNAEDGVDLAVEEEALERYYRQRIKEIKRDERPAGGRFIPIEEVRRAIIHDS